jgi:hypothetical protein
MLAVAVARTAVTAWEIFSVVRRALRGQRNGPVLGASQPSGQSTFKVDPAAAE